MQITVECFVETPPDATFSAAIDISNWPRFISGVQSVELLTPGPVAAGTRFREARSMVGRQASEDFEGRPATLLARLFTPLGWLFLGTLKRQLESDLDDLKLEAERRHRQREA